MNKYDMRICRCGKIHMIPCEKIDDAIKQDKDFMFICADCGSAMVIGADKKWDEYEPDKECYMMYSRCFAPYYSESITEDDFKGTKNKKAISEIYYSHGIKVPMMNGYYATKYHNGIFYDGGIIANLYEIDRLNVTAAEVQDFIKKSRKEARTVNMNCFIRDNKDDMLEEISHYLIKGFDWKGTKYEKEWNK